MRADRAEQLARRGDEVEGQNAHPLFYGWRTQRPLVARRCVWPMRRPRRRAAVTSCSRGRDPAEDPGHGGLRRAEQIPGHVGLG
jgi:hypothetical protein